MSRNSHTTDEEDLYMTLPLRSDATSHTTDEADVYMILLQRLDATLILQMTQTYT